MGVGLFYTLSFPREWAYFILSAFLESGPILYSQLSSRVDLFYTLSLPREWAKFILPAATRVLVMTKGEGTPWELREMFIWRQQWRWGHGTSFKRGRTMWKGHLAKFKITFVKRVNSREGWVQIRTDNSRRYPAINLNLVLSKESTATKDVGTTVDKTTIPV